jgi:hypothetical protein
VLKAFEDIKHMDVDAFDLCVIGAGPVGIAATIACQRLGFSVLVLESGLGSSDGFDQTLRSGHAADLSRHTAPGIAACRGLGGTSRWWGGRCVAFDDVDFLDRDHVDTSWPVSHEELRRHYAAAADFFRIGSADFRGATTGGCDMDDVHFADLERWTPVIDMGVVHRQDLERTEGITLVLGTTVIAIGLSRDGGAVDRLVVANAHEALKIAPRRIIMACGGLEGTRLLLATRRDRPDAFGGENGALGQYYMGHISGKIADLILDDPGSASRHDFLQDSGVFVRRRLTLSKEAQLRERLLNIAFWADNPPFQAADHRNGVLSLVWIALAIRPIGRLLLSEAVRLGHLGKPPYRWPPHLRNVLRAPIATAFTILQVIRARFLSSPRKPGFLLHSESGRYALHYHSEQSPDRRSHVALSSRRDPLGLPYLEIDLRFRRSDAEAIVRAHDVLDRALRTSGFGRLEFYDNSREQQVDRVMAQAADGIHQIGTTRMGVDESKSVVDANCRVHGVRNLYVLSSSVFASSGQASPTFLAVAMAFRLATHLRDSVRPGAMATFAEEAPTCATFE